MADPLAGAEQALRARAQAKHARALHQRSQLAVMCASGDPRACHACKTVVSQAWLMASPADGPFSPHYDGVPLLNAVFEFFAQARRCD